MGRAGEPGVVDVCADPPMRADGLHSVTVIRDVMHVVFYEDRPSLDLDGVIERHISGHLAIQMSGIPMGLVMVASKAAVHGVAAAAQRLPPPEQLMSWLGGWLVLLDRL